MIAVAATSAAEILHLMLYCRVDAVVVAVVATVVAAVAVVVAAVDVPLFS